MPDNILSGLRVIDAATYIAAPSAAAVLSDFGAEVIKIERPPHGDPYRYLPQTPGLPVSDWNYCWQMEGRNKRTIALNLNGEEGREIMGRLVRKADVFITNYQPQLIRKFRLSYEELRAENPRLVYASVTGYGETGPEAEKPGYDMTAYFARSGLMNFIRNADADPALSPCGFGDHPTAMTLFGAVMLALYRRERTGAGSRVTTNLMHNGVWSNGSFVQAALFGAQFLPNRTRTDPHTPMVNHYQASDGKRFLFTLLDPVQDWPKLCAAISRPDLVADPRYSTPQGRRERAAELTALLDAEFSRKPMAEWVDRFERHDVLFGPVADTADIPADPQMEAAGVFVPLEGGPVPLRTITSPLQVDGVTKEPARYAPGVGAHTREVLLEAGYTPAEIDALLARGVAMEEKA